MPRALTNKTSAKSQGDSTRKQLDNNGTAEIDAGQGFGGRGEEDRQP